MQDRLDALVGSRHRHTLTRRSLIQALATIVSRAVLATRARAAAGQRQDTTGNGGAEVGPYDPAVLPPGVRSRFVNNGNGLRMHVLEAGFGSRERPCVVLLHGFPELAYSWRKAMPALASAGFHVIAPDLRGCGRTSGGGLRYEDDASDFLFLNEVRDILGLVFAFGYRSVAAVVGHDWGSPIAAWCSLVRPEVFRSVVLMSGPFAGPPVLQATDAETPTGAPTVIAATDPTYENLAKLTLPRKHYQQYYATREANDNMCLIEQPSKSISRETLASGSTAAACGYRQEHPAALPSAQSIRIH
jgi:pimeloyl-ACP methyl ester carboxylesterase